jgi:hypothetical protein
MNVGASHVLKIIDTVVESDIVTQVMFSFCNQRKGEGCFQGRLARLLAWFVIPHANALTPTLG